MVLGWCSPTSPTIPRPTSGRPPRLQRAKPGCAPDAATIAAVPPAMLPYPRHAQIYHSHPWPHSSLLLLRVSHPPARIMPPRCWTLLPATSSVYIGAAVGRQAEGKTHHPGKRLLRCGKGPGAPNRLGAVELREVVHARHGARVLEAQCGLATLRRALVQRLGLLQRLTGRRPER